MFSLVLPTRGSFLEQKMIIGGFFFINIFKKHDKIVVDR